MRIFISYRTDKASAISETIEERLHAEFPNARVFRAASKLRGINATEDWVERLCSELLVSDFYVIVIDEDWVAHVNHDDPSYVRLETQIALVRSAAAAVYFFPVTRDPAPGERVEKVRALQRVKRGDLPGSLAECLDKQWPLGDTVGDLLDSLIDTIRERWTDVFLPLRLPILFIGSPFVVEGTNEFLDYFGYIAGEVARAFSRQRLGEELTLDCIIKLPSTEDTVMYQVGLLREAQRHSEFYRAVIVAPFETEGTFDAVMDLMEKRPHLPVFTIDKTYESLAKRKGKMPPVGVVNDWVHGGDVAGGAAVGHLQGDLQIESPRILVVGGLEGSRERVDAFRKRVCQSIPKAELSTELQGNFQKGKARSVVWDYLRSLKNQKQPLPHLIFCANDEMAIGVREAVLEWERAEWRRSGIVIIGYDGIEAMRELIEVMDPYILNTVDVKFREQVRRLSRMVVDHLLNRPVPTRRVIPVQGELVRLSDEQRKFTVQWAKGLSEGQGYEKFDFCAFGVEPTTVAALVRGA